MKDPLTFVETRVALLPCDHKCKCATKHFYSRLIEDPENKPNGRAKAWDAFYRCVSCGNERKWGQIYQEDHS